MKVLAMITAELRRLTATRMSVIALIALLLVPVLYGGLYLWANQDPYGRFPEVPVALVDLDEGVPAGDGQDAVDYGAQTAQELLDGDAFDWRLLSAAAAESALRDGAVDFIVTIPSDFSAALTSVASADPRKAQLVLQTNDANNYLASSIGTQAVERIRRSVAELVGSEAASHLLTGMSEIRSNLQDAVDGASQLASGSHDAASGAHEAADGAGQLADGADRLVDGTAQLADGSAQLADGTAQVADGAHDLADGAARVADGAHQVADGTHELAGYADRAGQIAQRIVDLLPGAREDIRARLAARGFDEAGIADILAALDPIADTVRGDGGRVHDAVAKVDELAAGAASLASGADELSGGASDLAAGADRAAAAAGQVRDGGARLATGAATLSDGAGTLASGTQTLADGVDELADGTGELRDGLADGVAQIPGSDAATRTAQVDTIADPVAVDTSSLASAGEYGAGLAPFFAALAGWIGIYALFLIVKPVSRRAVTALHTPLRITLAGWLTPALLGSVGMVALYGVLSLALGIPFVHPVASLGVLLLASFTYAAIVLCLNVWLGSVGQFLGLVLMVLQLVTSGGTFPWQTLPAPLAALHQALPMGYVVDALRQVMYGGSWDRLWVDVAVLATWLAGALLLTAVGVRRMTRSRTLRDLQPSLIG